MLAEASSFTLVLKPAHCLALEINWVVSMEWYYWPETTYWIPGWGKCKSLDIFFGFLARKGMQNYNLVDECILLFKQDAMLLLLDTEEKINL